MLKNNLGAIVLILLICGICFFAYNLTNKETNPDLTKALNDSLRVWKDKDSLNNVSISTIEADRNTLIAIVEQKDKELKEALNNPKIKEVIKIKLVTKFDSILVADSIGEDCRGEWAFDNNWVSADIKVHKDTLMLRSLIVRNHVQITHEEEKDATIVHVKQLNPYTETTYLKNYSIPRQPLKKNRWLKNLLIGIGVGTVVGLVAH